MADNKRMILNLFAGMQDALFLGDRFARGEFVSFLQPGQFMSSSLQEDDSSDDMAIQAALTDILIDSSYVNTFEDISFSGSNELPGRVSQVYYDILNKSAVPYKAMEPAILKELAELSKWIIGNQANYELYRERYGDAAQALEAEQCSQHPSPAKMQRLQAKKHDAANL